jgi:hypothetical protein
MSDLSRGAFMNQQRFRTFKLSLAIGALVSTGLLGGPRGGGLNAQGARVSFVPHVIAERLTGGYQTVAADMNGDARLDVIALALAKPTDLVWFENPSWTRHPVGTFADMINVAPHDLDGDRLPELALAHGFSTSPTTSEGRISLLTRPRQGDGPWTEREIDRLPTSHRLRWLNADGRQRAVLVNAPLVGAGATPPEYRARNAVVYYESPDWRRQTMTTEEEGVLHGLSVTDTRAGERQHLLSASFLGIFEHELRDGRWIRTRLTSGDPSAWPKSGASDVALGRHGSSSYLAAIEPWHGNQVVVYRSEGSAWIRQVLDTQLSVGHTISTGDFAGDGRTAVVAGARGAGGGLFVYWPPRTLGEPWQRQVLSPTMQASGCSIADLNADSRADIVCVAPNEPGLVWFENVKG